MAGRVPTDAVRAAIGDVEEIESLGGGGQGDVWRVREGDRDDIVKVLADASPERVEREIGGLRSVDSPYVMKFSTTLAVEHDGMAYPAFRGEYIEGGTIATRLGNGEWPSEREALDCVAGVLRGVLALHDRELVHRDIKPQNVGLRGGRWAEPVVLDLGLVRDLTATSITAYPARMGTIPFMAPEQLRMERAVKRTDVFAVGVLAFLLLTQRLPYVDPADTSAGNEQLRRRMLERVESDEWPKWGEVSIAQDIASLLERMMARDAWDRPKPREALQLVDDLVAARS